MLMSQVNARVLIVKKILPLLLLATLGMLVALPHIAAAEDQGDQGLNGDHHQTDHEIGHETLAEFHIRLAGDQQIPPVNTTAFGFAEVRLFQNGTSTAIEFRVLVCNIANVTLAHIHVGAVGTSGLPFVPFFGTYSPVSITHGCILLSDFVRGAADLFSLLSS